jgi:MFS family permease
MRSTLDMLRRERDARLFFIAHAQSSLGTGVGYVALVLVAYDRLPSAWGITLVLLADFLPATFLGAIFGAAADRWSRRTCAVVADAARAIAFIGIGLVGGIEATVALALLGGFGAGLFQPAILSGLPTLVHPSRRAPAMSLYGSIGELGAMLGSALAAGLLLVTSAETLLIADGITFGLSAIALAVLPFRDAQAPDAADGPRPSLLQEAREGLGAARSLPGVLPVVLGSGFVLLFAGMLTVVELLYATEELDAGSSGFSILVALSGLGILIGNGMGARGGDVPALRRGYLIGLLVVGVALIAMSVAPTFALACVAFVVVGIGNGMVLIYGRLLLQVAVPDRMLGRIFGIKDAVLSGAFGIAFISAGALAEGLGTRAVLAIAGAGSIATWIVAAPALRRARVPELAPASSEP